MGKNRNRVHYQQVQNVGRKMLTDLAYKLVTIQKRVFKGFSGGDENQEIALQGKIKLKLKLEKEFHIETHQFGQYWQDKLSEDDIKLLVKNITKAVEEMHNSFSRDQNQATLEVQKNVSAPGGIAA